MLGSDEREMTRRRNRAGDGGCPDKGRVLNVGSMIRVGRVFGAVALNGLPSFMSRSLALIDVYRNTLRRSEAKPGLAVRFAAEEG